MLQYIIVLFSTFALYDITISLPITEPNQSLNIDCRQIYNNNPSISNGCRKISAQNIKAAISEENDMEYLCVTYFDSLTHLCNIHKNDTANLLEKYVKLYNVYSSNSNLTCKAISHVASHAKENYGVINAIRSASNSHCKLLCEQFASAPVKPVCSQIAVINLMINDTFKNEPLVTSTAAKAAATTTKQAASVSNKSAAPADDANNKSPSTTVNKLEEEEEQEETHPSTIKKIANSTAIFTDNAARESQQGFTANAGANRSAVKQQAVSAVQKQQVPLPKDSSQTGNAVSKAVDRATGSRAAEEGTASHTIEGGVILKTVDDAPSRPVEEVAVSKAVERVVVPAKPAHETAPAKVALRKENENDEHVKNDNAETIPVVQKPPAYPELASNDDRLPVEKVVSEIPNDGPDIGGSFSDDDEDDDGQSSVNTVPKTVRTQMSDEAFRNDLSPNSESQSEDDQDSYFFSYFLFFTIVSVIGYVGYHNKQKIFALLLEGRRGRATRRRPNTACYRKLDSNLEEAVTSSCNANTTHVIY